MHKLRKLSLFVACFFLLQATACRKDKKITPASPKTTEDYIREMVGTYKMVGYYRVTDPVVDSYADVSETWMVEYVGNKTILVGNSIRGKGAYTFIFHDTAESRLAFARNTSSLTIDNINYFYKADSITYEGRYESSFRTQSEKLHSVR
ncbi:MAG: hypothetical protein IAE95_09140 [Chitinophagaceae bacterium]|nr:hypothetical protein [Chitinophagaceae bacterium]